MTERLEKIFSVLPCCEVFVDIGCDHGYIAKSMIESQKCKKAIVSDISQKCLQKAEKLLYKYIQNGSVTSVVCDGFDEIDGCDLALIAGMGGQEICDIISRAKTQNKLPENLVLQPMKNCEKVRVLAVELGYKIISDKVFFSANKYYNLIVLAKGKDCLTDEEIEFGRDNLRLLHDDFKLMIKQTLTKQNEILKQENLTDETRKTVKEKVKKLEKYV